MKLKYDVADDGSIVNAHFDGLTGCEPVTTLKQALTLLQIKNPALVFTEDAKAGVYDHVPDKDYYRLLAAVESISILWRHAGDYSEGKPTQPSLNPLTLLANAVELIGQMHAQLQQTQPGTVQPHG